MRSVFSPRLRIRMRWLPWVRVRISTGMSLSADLQLWLVCDQQRKEEIYAREEKVKENEEKLILYLPNSVFEAELQDVIPICHVTIAGTRIIGRLTAGYVTLPFANTQEMVERRIWMRIELIEVIVIVRVYWYLLPQRIRNCCI